MILTGNKIRKEQRAGRITLDPFDLARVTTNSYDLSLGDTVIRYTSPILDPREKPEFEVIPLLAEGLEMKAGDFLLGHSVETIGSDHYVPIVHAKSGTARMGLFIHVTADLIDLGYRGNTTFQLYATLPIRIYPGMKIAQVSFWVPKGKITLYEGKYQNGTGPQISKSYLDQGTDNSSKAT